MLCEVLVAAGKRATGERGRPAVAVQSRRRGRPTGTPGAGASAAGSGRDRLGRLAPGPRSAPPRRGAGRIRWRRRRLRGSGRPGGPRRRPARRRRHAGPQRHWPPHRRSGRYELACEALEVLGQRERQRDLAAAEEAFTAALVLADQHGLRLWRIRALHELGTIDLIGGGPLDRLAQARQAALDAGALATAATVSLQMAAWSGNHADPEGALAAGRSLRCRGEPAAASSRRRGGVRPAGGRSRSSGSARRDGGGHRQGRHRLRRPSRGPWGRRAHGPGAAVAGPGGPSAGTGRARRGYGAVARHPGHGPQPGSVGAPAYPRPRRWAGRGGRGGGLGPDRVLADPGLGGPRPRGRAGPTGPYRRGGGGLRQSRRRPGPLRLVSPPRPPTGGRGGDTRPVGRPEALAGRRARVLRRRPGRPRWPPPADPFSGRPAPRYPAAAGRHRTCPTP